ncbi:MAG: dienelactone hydrolase family protein [Deltaproteobacteria bacterium]|nr:dienelactone hydrolase family protein [Deltaproteobacteria bacterium]
MRTCILAACLVACTRAPAGTVEETRAPAGPGPIEETRVAGQRCLVQRVGGARPGDSVPLILSLHAMGADPAGALEPFATLRVPALVVAPCGGREDAVGNCEWFALSDPRGPQDAAVRVLAVAAALPHRGLPVVMGFSQGAVVAFALAHDHPEAVAAVFPVAGTLPPSTSTGPAARRPEVHAFLGEADPVFPLAGVRDAIAILRAEGYTADLRTYPGLAHDLSRTEAADVRAAVEAALR